ncbi:survival motor neuron protein isoform X1 [Nothobranchius furzeri]|uniref:survival motor neuron protein isoform X1 n=1 Tax=Nothobranchius furzeri TaxID=105023 RepID=UPI0024041F8A|nr:survival motor neuron protein-like isoform X1 [Nothobranchius furzeri]XP_054607947.1 survival motor neuron protein-like isoform X1 [Nothobranchius furzeri]
MAEFAIHRTVSQDEENSPEAENFQTSSEEKFETSPEKQQDITSTVPDASEETVQKQEDGQTGCPLTETVSSTELQWKVGAPCRACWSQDGEVYAATVVAVDGERCRVRFNEYGNEEDMDLSSLQSPESLPLTRDPQPQDWKPGSRCRAVYSVDGLVYPAVIQWVKGQRCCVRYDEYNNEEELDISSLLSHNELHGPSRASVSAAKGSNWKTKSTSNVERRRRREEKSGGRDDENCSTPVRDETWNQNQAGMEAEPSSNLLFPPFPPPRMGLENLLPSFSPPPLPSWAFSGKDAEISPDINVISSMLMLWYLCGFHTGCYMTREQFKSSSKDDAKSPC